MITTERINIIIAVNTEKIKPFVIEHKKPINLINNATEYADKN